MNAMSLQVLVLQDLVAGQLTASPMTLWLQKTGHQATEYAIELMFAPVG